MSLWPNPTAEAHEIKLHGLPARTLDTHGKTASGPKFQSHQGLFEVEFFKELKEIDISYIYAFFEN